MTFKIWIFTHSEVFNIFNRMLFRKHCFRGELQPPQRPYFPCPWKLVLTAMEQSKETFLG